MSLAAAQAFLGIEAEAEGGGEEGSKGEGSEGEGSAKDRWEEEEGKSEGAYGEDEGSDKDEGPGAQDQKEGQQQAGATERAAIGAGDAAAAVTAGGEGILGHLLLRSGYSLLCCCHAGLPRLGWLQLCCCRCSICPHRACSAWPRECRHPAGCADGPGAATCAEPAEPAEPLTREEAEVAVSCWQVLACQHARVAQTGLPHARPRLCTCCLPCSPVRCSFPRSPHTLVHLSITPPSPAHRTGAGGSAASLLPHPAVQPLPQRAGLPAACRLPACTQLGGAACGCRHRGETADGGKAQSPLECKAEGGQGVILHWEAG